MWPRLCPGHCPGGRRWTNEEGSASELHTTSSLLKGKDIQYRHFSIFFLVQIYFKESTSSNNPNLPNLLFVKSWCLFVCFSFIKEYTSGFLWWANPSSIIWFKQIFSGSRLLHEVSKAPLTVWHVLCLLGVALSQCGWRVSRALRGPGGKKMSWQRVTKAIMQSRSGSLLILPCAAQEEREKYPLPL